MSTETVVDLANEVISQREQACEHLLEMAAKAIAADDSGAPKSQANYRWEHLRLDQRSSAKANVDVHLDN